MLTRKDLLGLMIALKFVVTNVKKVPSKTEDLYKLKLLEPLRCEGSLTTDQGKKKVLETNEIFVRGEDIDTFLADSTKDDEGFFHYEGDLETEVSNPKFHPFTGDIIQEARGWITSEPYSVRGSDSREKKAIKTSSELAKIFGGETDVTKIKEQRAVLAAERLAKAGLPPVKEEKLNPVEA